MQLGLLVAFLLIVFVVIIGCEKNSQSPQEICLENLAMIWDAAGSHYLENRIKPDELIFPKNLLGFFKVVPRCPLSGTDYAPFKLSDGPKCPVHGKVPIFEKIQKIMVNTGRTAEDYCQINQSQLWEAAAVFYLNHKLKPEDLVDPKNFGLWATCSLETNTFPAFRLFEGPKCRHHGQPPMPKSVVDIK